CSLHPSRGEVLLLLSGRTGLSRLSSCGRRGGGVGRPGGARRWSVGSHRPVPRLREGAGLAGGDPRGISAPARRLSRPTAPGALPRATTPSPHGGLLPS